MVLLYLGLALLVAQYVGAMYLKRDVRHLCIATNTACLLAAIFLGYHLVLSNHYRTGFLWGVPVSILRTNDGVIKLVTELEAMEVTLQKLETDVKQLRRFTTQLTLQQRYSNHHLYNRLVEVDQTSRLNPILLHRLGPYSNINLPDRSGTTEVIASLIAYEATIRQQLIEGTLPINDGIEALAILTELRENLEKTRLYQTELKNKLITYYASKQLMYFQEPVRQPQYEELEPSYEEMLPEPSPYERGMSISDHEASILYKGHHLMGMISETQLKLVQTTYELMDKLSKLMHYREAVRLGEESAFYRVSSSGEQLITFLFMEDRAIEAIKSGDPIFQCRLGIFRCSQVGVVKRLYVQPQRSAHPYTGVVLDGFLAEVELSNEASRARVLHIKQQPFI